MKPLTFNDLIASGTLSTFGSPLTTADIIVTIIISFLAGIFIFYVYKKTYTGVLYSKNFNMSLIMTSMVSTVVMMAIGGNLALSLGMVGALSIIRFRTPIKDSKDLAFLFWAITAGITAGSRSFKLLIISSLMIGLVMYILSKRLVLIQMPYVVIIKYSKIDDSRLVSILRKYCSKFEIRSNVIDDDGASEKTIEVRIKDKNIDQLLKNLKGVKGVKKVMIFSHTGELSE